MTSNISQNSDGSRQRLPLWKKLIGPGSCSVHLARQTPLSDGLLSISGHLSLPFLAHKRRQSSLFFSAISQCCARVFVRSGGLIRDLEPKTVGGSGAARGSATTARVKFLVHRLQMIDYRRPVVVTSCSRSQVSFKICNPMVECGRRKIRNNSGHISYLGSESYHIWVIGARHPPHPVGRFCTYERCFTLEPLISLRSLELQAAA